MIAQTEQIKKIDISQIKQANIPGLAGKIISEQPSEMNIDNFIQLEKTLEQILKHKESD